MGREAKGHCTIGGRTDAVKALLEADELIIRGNTIKRRLGLASLQGLRVDGSTLCFSANGEVVSLAFEANEAQKWLQKIVAPPPSLAAKLGVGPDSRAFVLGSVDDAALSAALQDATTPNANEAAVLLTVAMQENDLRVALVQHSGMPCKHVWIVYEKGPKARLGDTFIRQALRERGYRDNKSCGVSARYTATRYARAD